MNKYERVIYIPSMSVDLATAKKITSELHSLTEDKLNSEMRANLENLFQSQYAGGGVQLFPEKLQELVDQQVGNPAARQFFYPAYAEKYTFLSQRGNVQFVGNNFELTDVPRDVDSITARADGPNGRFIDLFVKCRFDNAAEAVNKNLRRIIVQGEDQNWVSATAERIQQALLPEQNKATHLFYSRGQIWGWLTFVLLVLAEYKVARKMFPSFHWNTPVNGLALLLTFVLFVANSAMSWNLLFRIIGYMHPYLKLEANLSRAREQYSRWFTYSVGAVYCALIAIVVGLN